MNGELLDYTKVKTAKCHYGIAIGLENDGVAFIVLANSADDLRKVKKFFGDEPLREESCKRAILVKSDLMV